MSRIAFILSVLILAGAARSGEVLLVEDFEKFDLKKPANWVVSVPDALSIVDETGHGKVLRIDAKGGWPHLNVQIDVNKLRGHQVRVAASVKFPGTYTPLEKKEWARPKLQLIIKDKNGKDTYAGTDLQGGKPDWQNVEGVITVDKEADSANLFLRVDLVTADILFDDVSVEVDPDLSKPPPKSMPAANPPTVAQTTPPVTPATPPKTTPAPKVDPKAPVPAPAPTGPEAIAKKAPKNTIEDGGFIFSPELALALQKAIKPGATKNSYALLGPGIPIKELEAKLPEKWTRVAASEKTAGPQASPRSLLASLPEFISRNKPEVVFFFGETTAGGRKPSSSEHFDWEDLARVCIRMGAIPVLAVPAAGTSDPKPGEAREDLRTSMISAAGDAGCAAIDLKIPSQIPRRVATMTDLFDKFVFCRVEPDAPAAGAGPKKPIEE